MLAQYHCRNQRRVAALRALADASPAPPLNGIDYLEVAPDQTRLLVHFVHDLGEVPAMPLTTAMVEIRGGVRVRNPRVIDVTASGHVLTVEVERPGDFSPYVLRLVASPADDSPPDQIDPALAQVQFWFKVDCPSDFDCRPAEECPPRPSTEPPIDYLARDYASFLRLMLDRLSALLPDWQERSPADLLDTLTELIAFRGDELSYYQDAVATEAYLGTARTRVSVRRHARLLDYSFHDGCNARVWVAFTVAPEADGLLIEGCDPGSGLGGRQLLTGSAGASATGSSVQTFETLHDLVCYAAHNEIPFYTWSDESCCLPKGATRAFLLDEGAGRLRLRAGDILIFEERRNPSTGEAADADRAHRHAVRLLRVEPSAVQHPDGTRDAPLPKHDPLTGLRFVEIEWDAADALPFPLCISTETQSDISVALGNVAAADHGRTIDEETLEERPSRRLNGSPRPLLGQTVLAPLTQQARVRPRGTNAPALIDPAAPAVTVFQWDMSDVRPAITLRENSRRWTPRRDLLASDRFAAEFVVETEDDGRAYLRFGDGVSGRRPRSGALLKARYRLGNGMLGNVGADSIARLAVPEPGVTLRNPMPAQGAVNPHPIRLAKLYAPQAFRRNERAVTTADHEETLRRHRDVQRAVATRRWTGSWHTTFVTVDRRGGLEVDPAFEAELTQFLERYRLAGNDIEIDRPRFVPLDVMLHVCVQPGYFAPDVKLRLLQAFSAGVSPAGEKGFFHPDNFSFGSPVYLSAIVARAMSVPGVASVRALRFHRFGRTPAKEIDEGLIKVQRLEIPQLDNDPNASERGRIEFAMEGGA